MSETKVLHPGRRIRSRIAKAGFATQREFANHIGWCEEHLSSVILGKRPMPKLLDLYLDAATSKPRKQGVEA